MEITTERENDTVVFKTQGRIDSANAMGFHDVLQGGIEATDRIVILDFGDISYISSAGLRVILMVAKELTRRGAYLAICSLSDFVREIFEVSGFDKIITVRPSKEEAITAIRG